MAPRSNVWLYFIKDDFKVECKQCGATIKTAGNTMNMWYHLKRRHPREYAVAQGTWDDPLSAVEEVVTSEQLLTEEQYEQELRKEAQQALDQLVESEVVVEETEQTKPFFTPMRIKTVAKRRHQSLPQHSNHVKSARLQNNSHDYENVLNALTNVQQTVQSLQKVDSYQVFGNFIAEELRKIPEEKLANQLQRKLMRFLMDCLDEAEQSHEKSVHNKNEF
ncbi:uncharacterized protein LOC129718831 [Wyeomyia smithii]|uniref:uncharacterized protein LOC129718831 n=1 Tax=Wyeomyia smithii TaxID=174621 RepID=UPI002467F454|nr:uncharacterized protein LOC129718831 [Wyeomyia smithii]